jgi:ParB-like chromosome segregation protein Spo0J
MNIAVTHNDAFPLTNLPPDAHLVGRAPAEIKAMAASLKEVQIEAIVVVQFGTGAHPQAFAYDVLCGTCRVKAARLNGMPALRADIWQGLTWDEFVRLRSVANSRRTKNPLADVEALREMVKLGLTYTEMARLLEKTPPEVKQLLTLLTLPPEIMRGVRDNRVALGVLAQVAKLGPARQQAAVEVLQTKGRLKGSDLAEINRASRAQAHAQLTVAIPALQIQSRPTLQALMARLVREQRIDLKGNGHPPAAQTLRLSTEDLAELQRLLPETTPVHGA